MRQQQGMEQLGRWQFAGIALLIFLISLTFCLLRFGGPFWQPEQSALWPMGQKQEQEEQQAQQEQQVPQDTAQERQESLSPELSGAQQDEPAQLTLTEPTQPQEQEEASQTQEPEPRFVDCSSLVGFQPPSTGPLLYGYGVGYDAICGDYRFHEANCYQADGGAVTAALDGVVQSVTRERDYTVVVTQGQHQLCYAGLVSCAVEAGEQVQAGQQLGQAGAYLFVQAMVSRQDS